MFAYRAEAMTPEQMAAEDPFGGNGIWLPLPGSVNSAILSRMETAFGGTIPSVMWPGKGAWADGSQLMAPADSVLARWESAAG